MFIVIYVIIQGVIIFCWTSAQIFLIYYCILLSKGVAHGKALFCIRYSVQQMIVKEKLPDEFSLYVRIMCVWISM